MPLSLGERRLGADAPCFLIAEIGSNHDGSLERGLDLIEAAAAAGADAVQFHSFRAAHLLARRWPCPDGGWVTAEAYPELARVELAPEWHAPLRARAHACGLAFLSIPFDAQRAELLAALGVAAFPVAAGDLTHTPLLRTLGGFGRPVLLGTNGAGRREIEAALAAVGEGAGGPPRRPPVVLVGGPIVAGGEADLRTHAAHGECFACPIGWTDRERTPTLALGAVALGAGTVVKPLTDDRTRRGPDHAAALEPGEFRALAALVRDLERGLGRGARTRNGGAADDDVPRRGVFAARALPAGAVLEAGDLKIVRPALGAPPSALPALLGRRLVRALRADEPVSLDDVA